MPGGSRLGRSAVTVTGTGLRSASSATAAARPWSVSTCGWMPRISSRSSAIRSFAWPVGVGRH